MQKTPLHKTNMEDTPLPLCLLNKLPSRARGFVKKTGMTCRAFLELTWEAASNQNNVGKKTWAEMEALKPELRKAMEKAGPEDAPANTGDMFQLNRWSFAGFDGYLEAFLKFYPPVRGCDMIFKHRLGLTGDAKPESLEVTRLRFNPVLTRERVRQMSEAITHRWFNDDSRCLVSDFLAKAESLLEARGGALPVAELTAALEEASGWKRTPNPARMARFLRLFKAADYYPKLQIVSSREFGKTGATAGLAERFKAFCADETRAFSEIDYAAFKAGEPGASYQAYQLLAFNLLLGDGLPLDKKRQLKAFATMGRLSFRDAGDARPVASKLLEALRKNRAAVTPHEWLRKARAMFPGEDLDMVQVRRMAHGYPEVIHYDRGKFIWHEYVSLPPGIAQESEKHFLSHLEKHGIDTCSVYAYYVSRQFELAAAGVVSQTLFYFLLKFTLSGALDFPEYPKVAQPGKDGGTGAFDRIILQKFGANRNVPREEFERYYSEVLCGDPRQIKWHLVKFRRSCALAGSAPRGAPAETDGAEPPPPAAPVPEGAFERVGALADAALAEAGLVWCNRLLEIHRDELRAVSVDTADALQAALRAARPGLHFEAGAFSKDPGLQPAGEIRRVLSAAMGEHMTLHALLVRLPYMPPVAVEKVLAENPAFVRVKSGRGKWILSHAVAITEEDREAVRADLRGRLQKNKWVPSRELDLSFLLAKNPGVADETLRAKIIREDLGGEFQERHGVLLRKGVKLVPRQALAAFCHGRETLTRAELIEAARHIHGGRDVPCLDVAACRMVRATADLFVAEHRVAFDAEKIDAALSALCPGDYIPMFAANDFSAFPEMDFPWNHALLESYCRKHSRVFTFVSFGWNVNSAGAIARKSSALKTFDAIVVDALARSGGAFPDAATAHQYLKREGYIFKYAPVLMSKILKAENNADRC